MEVRQLLRFCIISALWLLAMPVSGEGLTFVLISKNMDDVNFIAAARGCAEAAREEGDECVHLGPSGNAHFRSQDHVVGNVLAQDVDGVAISVINGEFLARSSLRQAEGRDIPIITFDSDMPAAFQDLRDAYVGPNNEEIGYSLGEIVNQFKSGGSLCLMSASPFDTNLNQRMLGVREAITDQFIGSMSQPLTGENGWSETGRCPWYNGDDGSRAVTQVLTAYTYESSDAIVSVGSWPLMDNRRLRKVLERFAKDLASDKRIFVTAVGELRPDDYALMDDGLVQGFVSIDFEAMGEESYRILKALAEGKKVDTISRTPVKQIVRSDLTEKAAMAERGPSFPLVTRGSGKSEVQRPSR